jgi:hypothetical protein
MTLRWFARYRERRSRLELAPELVAHNADPKGGAWTGYDEIEAQMRGGARMAIGVGVVPSDAWQYARYQEMQRLAPELGYGRQPAAPHGTSALHFHFERSANVVARRPAPPPTDRLAAGARRTGRRAARP